MPVRADERLLDAPMVPVACRACGARVGVRKSSWEQTSVQWDDAARGACLERRGVSPGPGPNGSVFTGCSTLSEVIREAAVRGEVAVRDETEAPVAGHEGSG